MNLRERRTTKPLAFVWSFRQPGLTEQQSFLAVAFDSCPLRVGQLRLGLALDSHSDARRSALTRVGLSHLETPFRIKFSQQTKEIKEICAISLSNMWSASKDEMLEQLSFLDSHEIRVCSSSRHTGETARVHLNNTRESLRAWFNSQLPGG